MSRASAEAPQSRYCFDSTFEWDSFHEEHATAIILNGHRHPPHYAATYREVFFTCGFFTCARVFSAHILFYLRGPKPRLCKNTYGAQISFYFRGPNLFLLTGPIFIFTCGAQIRAHIWNQCKSVHIVPRNMFTYGPQMYFYLRGPNLFLLPGPIFIFTYGAHILFYFRGPKNIITYGAQIFFYMRGPGPISKKNFPV